MRTLPTTLVALGLATPALATGTETLTCAYASAAGGTATVSVTLDEAGQSPIVVAVSSGPADLTLRKTGRSGKGLEVKSWDVTRTATEIAFTSAQGTTKAPGHVSFEAQDDMFRFEVKGAPPALRQALRLNGGWFVLKLKPGAADCQMATVGVATLQHDGALRMQYRSYDHGMLAEALHVVKPDGAGYKELLDHLGGLKPGESKPIPEFPPRGEVR